MHVTSSERQKKIKELIENNFLSDQGEIVALLQEKYKINTTQAQISRDLRKMGVIKRKSDKGDFYQLPVFDAKKEILKLGVLSIGYNEALVVIKTRAGLAPFVGDYIDEHFHESILGCISGENTVFVTPVSSQNTAQLFELFKTTMTI